MGEITSTEAPSCTLGDWQATTCLNAHACQEVVHALQPAAEPQSMPA